MIQRPPRSTRTNTLLSLTTLFRSALTHIVNTEIHFFVLYNQDNPAFTARLAKTMQSKSVAVIDEKRRIAAKLQCSLASHSDPVDFIQYIFHCTWGFG